MNNFRIVAVTDSDSYLKFACATLDGMDGWVREVVVLRSPIQPTTEQISAAVAGTFMEGRDVRVVTAARLKPLLHEADVVLAAATGPVAEEVFLAAHRLHPRPALVSALPGVALPATAKAMRYRALGDAFITHSYAECRAFSNLAEQLRYPQTMLLSRLPFLSGKSQQPLDAPLDCVVFAPQAKVPEQRHERELILAQLAKFARRQRQLTIRVKPRARAGEPQTHRELYPYDRLWAEMTANGRVTGDELAFTTGPMKKLLRPGTSLVTVSSTAALEAIDAGLPVLVLNDFGVSDAMLNRVFSGSGLLGSLEDLSAGQFFHPGLGWLRDNYFHQSPAALEELLDEYARHARDGRYFPSVERLRRARRRRWRLRIRTALPTPALKLVRRIREYTA